jgi:flagella basal body P-ring formation protein FlgA
LAYGRVLSDDDLETKQGDLAELPPDIVMERKAAVGRTLNVSLAAGQVIRSDSLRLPVLVQQGQQVTVISRGAGFQVSSEGQALNNGSEGQIVRIRMPNGQIVSGQAKGNGTVEISR